ncbi:hypothetical protein GBA52_001517 [Prunus armeniaca]|nr:hypothetical protein GBA52_001517 [Prunus armeniaca]
MDLKHGGDLLCYHLEKLVPIARAPEKLQSPQILLFSLTNQSSREASELRLKRQVVGKCELSMLLATTTTCRQIAEDSLSASIGHIAAVDLGLER